MGIFYETETASPEQVKGVGQFMSEWFTRIKIKVLSRTQ